jgi:sugar/nucleoside kinase (ribokinase family)
VHLVVIGDIAWDIFIRPERDLVRGSDVFGTVDVMPGGAAANVAVWARRLGLDVTLRGKVGDDTLGQVMQAHLRREGLDAGLQIVPGGLTTRVGILLAADGEHSFVIDHTKVLRFGDGDAPAALADGADAVFFNGYDVFLARSAAFLDPVLAAARRRGTPVVFDPSSFALIGQYGAERLLANVGPLDVLIANEDEAKALAPPAEGLHGLLRHTRLLVVKQGANGASALDATGWTHASAEPIAVVDTTGAGDAFAAAFVADWLAHRDVARALGAGNRLGAHVAGHLGGQPPPPGQ